MTPPDNKPWQVYILRCADETFYTGVTRDLSRRLAEHNDGLGAKYTRGRRPVVLAYSEDAANRSLASRREMEIKRMLRSHKLKLIARNRDAAQK